MGRPPPFPSTPGFHELACSHHNAYEDPRVPPSILHAHSERLHQDPMASPQGSSPPEQTPTTIPPSAIICTFLGHGHRTSLPVCHPAVPPYSCDAQPRPLGFHYWPTTPFEHGTTQTRAWHRSFPPQSSMVSLGSPRHSNMAHFNLGGPFHLRHEHLRHNRVTDTSSIK